MNKRLISRHPKISTNVRIRCCRFLHRFAAVQRPTVRCLENPSSQTIRSQPRPGLHRLENGVELRLRPVIPSDRREIERFFLALSPHSRQQRFLRPVERLTPRELTWLIATHAERHWGWIATTAADNRIVGFAQAIREDAEPEAEIAVAILDHWQGQRLGTILLAAAGSAAAASGVDRLFGYTFQNNRRILTYGDRRDAIITLQGGGTVRLSFTSEQLLDDLPFALRHTGDHSETESCPIDTPPQTTWEAPR